MKTQFAWNPVGRNYKGGAFEGIYVGVAAQASLN